MNTHTSRPAYSNRKVYIVDGNRSPFLKATGRPGPLTSSDLATATARSLLKRQAVQAADLDEVIFGCVMPAPDEANIARLIALRIGCGHTTPAWTVQRNCASGMQAIDCAASNISTGRSDLVLAGGCEAMSHAPVLFRPEMVAWLADWQKARDFKTKLRQLIKLRPSCFKPVIGLLKGLKDPIVNLSMGQTAEVLAYHFGVERNEMDQFALASHRNLANAIENDYLSEISPIISDDGFLFDHDTGFRPDCSLDQLAQLRPVFDKHGLVSAGNSAQVTDGAACLLLASEEAIDRFQLGVLGELVDCQWAGLDPAKMGLGPVYAVPPLLHRHDLAMNDIDYWEINEAFATQVLACLSAWQDENFCRDELGLASSFGVLDRHKLNVDGGAIALGHPVGASGARIVLHLLHVLQRTNSEKGVATLCIGGGQGGAMLVSRTGVAS